MTVDEDPDVCARVVDVVAHLEPCRATPVLTPLPGDSIWVVRLHAVRALDHQGLGSLLLLTQRLTDPNSCRNAASTESPSTVRSRAGEARARLPFLAFRPAELAIARFL